MIYMDVTHAEGFIFEGYYTAPSEVNVSVISKNLRNWLYENNISPILVTNSVTIPREYLGQDINDSKFVEGRRKYLKMNLIEATSDDIGNTIGHSYLGFDTMDELLLFKLTWL